MNTPKDSSRREFMKTSGQIAAATTLVASAVPTVHAAEDNTIRVALIGCGGRGSGAAVDALSVQNGPIKLVAMADVFERRLNSSYENLKLQVADRMDVPKERRFVGFDGYQQAMDCLRPGDVVIFATPPGFRWVHFDYAVEKKLNVFMEKPVTVDGPSTRRFLEITKKSEEANLKVGVGLMCRHCEARGELFDRIQSGEIGDLITLRAFRATGPVATEFSRRRPKGMSELMYQIQRFHSFLWASGGCFSDFLIHNIDECCWMKNAWPVEAKGFGGRHYRDDYIDQNFDVYNVEYTFPDGSKLILNGRNVPGCDQEFASYAHGTKGSAVISASAHYPARSRIYKGQQFKKSEVSWAFDGHGRNPYRLEWEHLVDAIRNDKPYNEARRGAEASLITSMGRLAAHTGINITRDEMLNHEHEFAPNIDKLTFDSAAPILADADGRYSVPMPGLMTDREYGSSI